MADAAVAFNQIPSNLVAPIFAAEVNSGGLPDQPRRLVLLGHKLAAGAAAAGVLIPITSKEDAAAAFGLGSMLYDMARLAFLNAPAAPVAAIAVDEVGAAAAWTVTLSGVPANTGQGALEINGARLAVTIAASDTPTSAAAALAAAINGFYDPLTGETLPVTATAAAAVVTIVARHKGLSGADVDLYVPKIAGNPFAATGVATIAQTVQGAGSPTTAAALAALGEDPADLVLAPWSDAPNLAAYAAWSNDVSGRWAWNRLSFGHVATVFTGTFAAAIALGQTLNDRHLTVLRRQSGVLSPGWSWLAARYACEAAWLFDDVNGNVARSQANRPVIGLRGVRDRSALDVYAAENQLNANGVSTWRQDQTGQVLIGKSVTTMRLGPQGQPDATFRDIQSVFQVEIVLQFQRSRFLTEHGNKVIADDNPGALPTVSTPKDIKATFLHAQEELARRGVIENVATTGRSLRVMRDVGNPARVNVYEQIDRTNPLDILALNATIYAALPR